MQDSILIQAMLNGYKLQHNPPWDALTDEANEKYAWSVERIKAPFRNKEGIGIWHGKTIFEALDKANKDLGV